MSQPEFPSVFEQLKKILTPYAAKLTITADTPQAYSLDVPYSEKWKKTVFFGSAQIKKNYVSFYLMPVYMFPDLLKGARYLWLKNEENLSEEEQDRRRKLCRSKLQTAKAYCHLATFQDLLKACEVAEAIGGLKWWYNWVCHSRIPEMIRE